MSKSNLIIVSHGVKYKFGVISSFRDTFTKSVSVTAIPSLSSDSAFPLESSSSLKYSVTFERKQPYEFSEGYDSNTNNTSPDADDWDNAVWMDRLNSLVERWQAKSNGYRMWYHGEGDGFDENLNPTCESIDEQINPYVPLIMGENVFITELSFTYEFGYPEYLKGEMQLIVGGNLNYTKDKLTVPLTATKSIANYTTSSR